MSDALDTAPADWTVGEVVTAAKMNTELRDKITAIANRLNDTGWITVAITNSAVKQYYAGSGPNYRVKNGICYFWGELGINNTTSYVGTFANLPPECRPANRVVFVCQASGSDRWSLSIQSNGDCGIENRYGPGTISTSVWLPFTVSWPVG